MSEYVVRLFRLVCVCAALITMGSIKCPASSVTTYAMFDNFDYKGQGTPVKITLPDEEPAEFTTPVKVSFGVNIVINYNNGRAEFSFGPISLRSGCDGMCSEYILTHIENRSESLKIFGSMLNATLAGREDANKFSSNTIISKIDRIDEYGRVIIGDSINSASYENYVAFFPRKTIRDVTEFLECMGPTGKVECKMQIQIDCAPGIFVTLGVIEPSITKDMQHDLSNSVQRLISPTIITPECRQST